jgi:tRNA pseudouridine32 synthase/23S rRNA pseudouridine746 synthase
VARLLPLLSAVGPRPSTLHLPAGDWATVLDCLCAHFANISRDVWLERMARGRVLGPDGLPIGPQQPFKVGLRVQYFREVAQEVQVPFSESIVYADEH